MAIDLPGHGGNRGSIRSFNDVVLALLADLPASVDRVVGYSFGGRIALALLRAAPERFASAAIISAHPGLKDETSRAARRVADQRWIRLLRVEGIEPFVEAWEQQPLFDTQQRLPREILDRQRARRLGQSPGALAQALERLGLADMPNAWTALDSYPGRLRWIVGDLDGKFLELGRQVLARRPQTDLWVLPGIGHNPLLEAPGLLASLLADFRTH